MNRRSSRRWLTLVIPFTILALVVSATRLPAADGLPTGTFVRGEWGVTFSADKTYHVTQNGELVVKGTYSGNHNQAVFQDTGGPFPIGIPRISEPEHTVTDEGHNRVGQDNRVKQEYTQGRGSSNSAKIRREYG